MSKTDPNPAPAWPKSPHYKANPFLIKKKIAKLAKQGIEVGVKVRHTFWFYGDQGLEDEVVMKSEHVGYVSVMDPKTGAFEINPSDESPGYYRTWITSLNETNGRGKNGSTVELIVEKKNPFLKKSK